MLLNSSRSLQTIYNPPSSFSRERLPTAGEHCIYLQNYVNLFREVYDTGHLYDTRGCPFVGDVDRLLQSVQDSNFDDMTVKETWLIMLPICVRHKQCVHCFQEADDVDGRGMIALRARVINAATELIAATHRVVAGDIFIPPLIASTRAFVAGCSLAVALSKRWIPSNAHLKTLAACTEILTLFAPHWQGGHNYLYVWRTIVQILDVTRS